MLYFRGNLCKNVSGKVEYKLQTAVPVLCWYFFNGSEKRKIFSFLIAKTYDISFYQQLSARVYPTKWEQFVWTRKSIPNKRCYPGNWAKYKILHIYFSRLLLIF